MRLHCRPVSSAGLHPDWRSRTPLTVAAWATTTLLMLTALVQAYPLDGFEHTGIRRLQAYQLIQQGRIAANYRLLPGALLGEAEIHLRLTGLDDRFDIPENAEDERFQQGLNRILSKHHGSYRAALLDITEPLRPRYASWNADQGYIPGSVGKLIVMTGLFNELKRRYPSDIPARINLLRNTMIAADRFVIPNSHAVPVVDPNMTAVVHRSVRVGDTFSLWEWLDHTVSPSSNAAASMVWKEALLMRAFGDQYPPTAEQQESFLKNTPKSELTDLSIRVVEEPLIQSAIDTEQFRIRTFFTDTAARVIPGRSSYCTPRQILRWLVKLEQGELVDPWSSLEMKKLLYFTRRRYRFAAAPVLANSALFFKSGSLYRCRDEEGYQCGQYRGNAENLMHSVAIVESPSAQPGRPVVYLISMMSNVLKVNSAQEHLEIATEIERLVQSLNP